MTAGKKWSSGAVGDLQALLDCAETCSELPLVITTTNSGFLWLTVGVAIGGDSQAAEYLGA